MTPDIEISPATPRDAADMAILDDMASHGLASRFWREAVERGEAEHAFAFGRARMADAMEPYSWLNCHFAYLDGQKAGMATGYLMPAIEADTKTETPFLKPVFELMAGCEGDWLLDALAVYPEHRRKGVARSLLNDCLIRARQAGAARISLIVDDDNTAAVRLYSSAGFSLLDSRPAWRATNAEEPSLKHLCMGRSL